MLSVIGVSRLTFFSEMQWESRPSKFDLTVAMLTRVFDACKKHGAVRFGEWVAEQYNQLNPSTPLRFELKDRRKIGNIVRLLAELPAGAECIMPSLGDLSTHRAVAIRFGTIEEENIGESDL
ncbi:hypothetical protein CRYUN_Cryun28dG0033300 [Craigia yunnanensis]